MPNHNRIKWSEKVIVIIFTKSLNKFPRASQSEGPALNIRYDFTGKPNTYPCPLTAKIIKMDPL